MAMIASAVDLGLEFELCADVNPFDWSAVAPVETDAVGGARREPESLGALQHWYDLGFLQVTRPGSALPEGFESTSTAELLAYWMGREDAAAGYPGQRIAS
jgi:hypothetical protein